MNVQADMPILYILMGIVILLALLAAVGIWLRGGGLKHDDVEALFNDAHERNSQEIQNLKAALEESRKSHAEGLSKTQADVTVRLRELESVVATAAREQGDSLTTEMEALSKSMAETELRVNHQLSDVSETLQQLSNQMSLAGEQMTKTLTEMARQQREQKAQSTIQLCEALITSLGTLKSSISKQIQPDSLTVDSEEVNTQSLEHLNQSEAPQQESAASEAWQSPFEDDVDTHHDEDELQQPDTVEAERSEGISYAHEGFESTRSEAQIHSGEEDNEVEEEIKFQPQNGEQDRGSF